MLSPLETNVNLPMSLLAALSADPSIFVVAIAAK
jgi:hypothetical protein